MNWGDDALDHPTRRRLWRLGCLDCEHVWRGRSAEAGPCPACDSWRVRMVALDALEDEPT